MISNTVPTVLTTATLLAAAGTIDDRAAVVLSGASETTWVGGAGVTSSNGYALAAGATLGPIELRSGDDLYGVTVSGTGTVRVLRTRA